jgi:glycerol-3-phosphate cytidylyltransferase-like family protein
VAVNDDESVTKLKGPGRPVMPAADRAEIVAAVAAVDYVVVFADPNVERPLMRLRPDVHASTTTRSTPFPNARREAWRPHGDCRRREAPRVARSFRSLRDERPTTND